MLFVFFSFFFFKQKTAYEMRISDWSSDVCSSDLLRAGVEVHQLAQRVDHEHRVVAVRPAREPARGHAPAGVDRRLRHRAETLGMARRPQQHRSEEHPSELQSLMRISYAVVCLKKKMILST